MARRLPSTPPVLAGFTHVRILGSGGFADVFLYEQNMPRRQVAVKVMLSEVVDEQVREMFQAEANLMAQLSAHPSILTVYQASVSADGRPYLVMEFCSAGLNERYRRERIPVSEVLRIAIRIGSAIQTAHRAGVLHRDIKPSNILLTAYGHPVLSDFGIAATLGDADHHGAIGMSIPWSAPEVLLDETPGTVQSEVWSFAATVYSLLGGRSPFEMPGESNKSGDLISRIGKAKVQPIGRPDVPASLERALQKAMARKSESRHRSILELVHEFQAIESELGVPQTPVEVAVDDWALSSVTDLEEKTQVRGVPGAIPAVSPRRRRRRRPVEDSQVRVGTAKRQTASENSGTHTRTTTRQVRFLAAGLIAASLAVVALGAAVTLALVEDNTDAIPTVTDIEAVAARDTVDFSWPDPGLLPGDLYQITSDSSAPSVQSSPDFTSVARAGERVCITVSVNREGRTGPSSNEKCADVPE